MVAANQVYHSKVAHAIQAMAMDEAEQAAKRLVQAEGTSRSVIFGQSPLLHMGG